jgi:hypothetical protein
MKIIISSILTIVVIFGFLSLNSHKNDIIHIRNFVKQCSGQLITEQIKSRTKTMTFNFEGQSFTMSIDTLGKPIFLNESTPVESIFLKYKDDNYKVELINGIIKVDVE